jgi:hypothetical protein
MKEADKLYEVEAKLLKEAKKKMTMRSMIYSIQRSNYSS